jgi:hypothetical protein
MYVFCAISPCLHIEAPIIMKRSTAIAAVAFLTASPLVSGQEAIEIKQEYRVGKRYVQEMKTSQKMKMDMGGQKMDMNTEITVAMTSTVTPGKALDTRMLTITYDRMAMDMDMMGQKVTYDSADKTAAANPMLSSLGQIIGKAISVELGKDNEVISVSGMDKLMGAAGNPMMKGMFSDKAMGQMIQQGLLQGLPTKPVKVGDSWDFSQSVELPQIGTVGATGTYTYTGDVTEDGAKCIKITLSKGKLDMALDGGKKDAKSAGESSPEQDAIAKMGMKLADSSMTGTLVLDPALAFVRKVEMDQNMTISMASPADPTQKMEMPLKQHITMDLIKVEDVKNDGKTKKVD